MSLFCDSIIKEYMEWKKRNPNNFTWESFVNMKADLQTALAFGKFLNPDIIEHEGCIILKERFDPVGFNNWKKACDNNKNCIEKMMNLYELEDFFDINTVYDEYKNEQIVALGAVIKWFWSISFKERYPAKRVAIDVFDDDGIWFITVYEKV